MLRCFETLVLGLGSPINNVMSCFAKARWPWHEKERTVCQENPGVSQEGAFVVAFAVIVRGLAFII